MTEGPWTRSMKVVHGPGPKWGLHGPLVHVLSSPQMGCQSITGLPPTVCCRYTFILKIENVEQS